jgi:glycosyltransferase involved in cell wall biosynthesis
MARLGGEHSFALMVAGRESGAAGFDARDGRLERADNFRVRSLPFSPRLWTIIWHRLGIPLPVDLLLGSVDVFHSPDYVLPPLRRGKTLVTIHDLSFRRYPEGAEPNLRDYLNATVPRSLERADLILGDSENTRQDIIEVFGVLPERVQVLYPGVDPAFRVIEDQQALAAVKEAYRLDYPFILSVGTLEPRKNLVALLDAYALLRATGEVEHRLVIVGGRGWLYDGIFRRVEELSLRKEVTFLGFLPEEHLPAIYCLSDLLVFPSLYEGFGLPPLEAMACGTPVVASDSSSLPEVVGDAGLMVQPDDTEALVEAIRRVLADSELRANLVASGLSRATEFTWQAAGRKLLAIYEDLPERGPV